MAPKQPESTLPRSEGLREKIHEIIFEADTPAGMLFDVALLIVIVMSVVDICLDTVEYFHPWHSTLYGLQWAFTFLFTAEYALRLYCVRRPIKYIFSFWGIIDLMSFLPDYLLLIPGLPKANSSFSVIRALRLLRVFRIFKLGWFQAEADDLGSAIWNARAKIIVFLTAVLIIVTVTGTLMYEIERNQMGDETQFRDIPEGIYWAIVTMTTVGFGDVVPQSIAGKFLASALIMLGYSLIIVPTGFVSAEIIEAKRKTINTRSCSSCLQEGHDVNALYCKQCGDAL